MVVSDQGRGIAEEHLEKIFEPFFTTGRHLGASGLGLAVVFNVVTQAMGGTVKVESREGEGVRVTLRLPFER